MAEPLVHEKRRHTADSSSLDVTPRRPSKKKIRKRSRMPNPTLHTSTSRSSSSISQSRDRRGARIKKQLFPLPSPVVSYYVNLVLSFRSEYSEQLSKPWMEEEVKALVNYLRCRGKDTWPTSKNKEFWDSAANFILNCTSSSHKRTGMMSVCINSLY